MFKDTHIDQTKIIRYNKVNGNVIFLWSYFNGLMQDCSISSADALEILQSCTKPSICSIKNGDLLCEAIPSGCPLAFRGATTHKHMQRRCPGHQITVDRLTPLWAEFLWRKVCINYYFISIVSIYIIQLANGIMKYIQRKIPPMHILCQGICSIGILNNLTFHITQSNLTP